MIDKSIDILINEDGDLILDDEGSPVVGNAQDQHLQMILESNPGDFKLYPGVGVGLISKIKSTELNMAKSAIKQQLEADGFTVKSVKVNGNAIIVEAER
jgi:hypothetical protein